jgi:hypothetical protein
MTRLDGRHRLLDAEPLGSDPADLELSGREDLNLRPFGPELLEVPSQGSETGY